MISMAVRRSTGYPPVTVLSFYGQPWWMILLKVVVIFVFLMLMTLFAIWAERRIIGRMQQRPGPNRAGPFGLLQSLHGRASSCRSRRTSSPGTWTSCCSGLPRRSR